MIRRLTTLAKICGIWLTAVLVFLLFAGWVPRTVGGWLFALFLGPVVYALSEMLFGLLGVAAMAFPPTRAVANWVKADGTSEQQWPRVIAVIVAGCVLLFVLVQLCLYWLLQ